MISPKHIVSPNSPPRFFIRGGDFPDDNNEPLSPSTTACYINKALESSSHPDLHTTVFLKIFFKYPKKKHTWQEQQLTSTSSAQINTENIEFTFSTNEENPVYFSSGFKARWSRIDLYYKGPYSNEEPILLQRHNCYLPPKNTENITELVSLDLTTHVHVSKLTDAMRSKIGLVTSKTRRCLFPEGDDAISRTQRQNTITLGEIISVSKVTILLPRIT